MVKIRKEDERVVKADGKSVTILDVRIDSTSMAQVLDQVRLTIAKKGKLTIVTPNPEIVLQAQNDHSLRNAINNSHISIPDGTGLLFANRFLTGQSTLPLIKGRELFVSLISEAEKNKWKVFLIGSKEGSAVQAEKELVKQYPNIKVYSTEGPNVNRSGIPETNGDIEVENETISKLNEVRPNLVFIGFGVSRQEKWMQRWYKKAPGNVWMVVGGTFDFISGKTILPPSFWPRNFEWAWRLLTKPSHVKRVFNATVLFPFRVLQSKF